MSRKEECLDDLRRRILSLDLAPGAELDEATLADHYALSRTPMREVLQRLNGAGLVEVTAHRGAKVSSLDLPALRMFFQTAPLVYATISRLAAEQRTAAQLETLKAIQAQFARAAQTQSAEAALLNHQFHAQIGQMAANPYLLPALERMLVDHTRLAQTFYRPASIAESVLVKRASAQHDALIAAIEARNTAEAVELTLEHWDLSRDRMEHYVRPDPLPLDPTQKDPAHEV